MCEVALVGAVERFEWLVNPQREPTQRALKLHGIEPRALEEAPAFGEIAEELARLMGHTLILAHRGLFDVRFLAAEFARARVVAPSIWLLDTAQLAMGRAPGAGSLAALARALEIEVDAARLHRARYDAELVYEVARRLLGVSSSTPEALVPHATFMDLRRIV